MSISDVLPYFRHRGVQVIGLVTLYAFLSPYLPTDVHRGLYTASYFIKDVLLWLLPITVGAFIAHTVCSFQRKAPLFILTIFIFEALSNFISVWYSYACGYAVQGILPTLSQQSSEYSFSALWLLPFTRPIWWTAGKGVVAGLVVGFIGAFWGQEKLLSGITKAKNYAQLLLTRFFSPLIPIFVLGFVAKMVQTHVVDDVIGHYGMLVLALVLVLAFYIGVLFLAGHNWSLLAGYEAAKNMMSAGGVAFTSGCSLSTMPWTIEGASKNMDHPELARAVIPATTNIQQIGDAITNAFICFLLYRQFFGVAPPLDVWLVFSMAFVLARFYTAAVLGGAIFVMLPVYETYLSFNSEMIAIILALNVILDPIVTATNVVANGALCRIFERVWGRVPGAFART